MIQKHTRLYLNRFSSLITLVPPRCILPTVSYHRCYSHDDRGIYRASRSLTCKDTVVKVYPIMIQVSSLTTCSSSSHKDPQQVAEEEIVHLQGHIRTHFQHANYTEALRVSERVLEKSLALFGSTQPNHPAIASAHNNMGLMYKMMGQYDLALKSYQVALHIYADILGKDHASYAATLNNIGNLYRAQAIQLVTEILQQEDDEEENNNNNNQDSSSSSSPPSTSSIHKQDWNYQMEQVLKPSIQLNRQALDCFEQAYQIRMTELGLQHVHTVTSQSNLGSTLATLIIQEEACNRIQFSMNHNKNNNSNNNSNSNSRKEDEDTNHRNQDNHANNHWLTTVIHRDKIQSKDDINSRWHMAETHLRASFVTAIKHPRGKSVPSSINTLSSSTSSSCQHVLIKKDRSKGKKERRKDVKEQKLMHRRQQVHGQEKNNHDDNNSDDDDDSEEEMKNGYPLHSIQTLSAATAAQNLAVFLKTKADYHTKNPSIYNKEYPSKTFIGLALESYAEANSLYVGSLRVRKALLGESHPDTIATKFSLAELLDSAGMDVEKAKLLREEILNSYDVSEKN